MSGPIGLARFQKTIISIFDRYNFTIHTAPEKTRVMYQDKEQVALGIKLNHGIGVPAAYFDKYDHKTAELGSNHPSVRGMRSYMRSLEPRESEMFVKK